MDDEILQEFLAESWENLGRLDSEIVELEKRPDDADLLASIFRTIHTIKGTCGFIGLSNLGGVAHSAENVLGKMRDGVLPVTPGAISLVLEAIDVIKGLLQGIEETGEEPKTDHSVLCGMLDELAEGGAGGADVPAEVAEPPAPAEPAAEPPAAAEAPAAPEATPVAEAAPEPVPAQPSAPAAAKPAAAGTAAEAPAGEAHKKSVADLSIRVNVDVLDSLMNLVGELVLTRNQLLQMARGDEESKYAAPITHLNRVTTDLQEGVMKTRMQPIGNAWSKLPRLIRDLEQVTSKTIELSMSGAETELDRTVLDAIKDPLTHMIRNSADHGLESAEARRAAGKPETGTINLDAFHEGGHVIIRIADDGGGIDPDRILRKALEKGVVSEAEAERLGTTEILQLIFRPGFSTAEKVSSVSGRGVGMDVVRTAIERIGGTVDLDSRLGSGTTIRIKIPLTLAIISALVVEAGGESFAIPQLGVVELVRLAAEDRQKIEKIHDREVFRLRDRLLPLVHLDEVLGLDDASERMLEGDVNIVVTQVGDEQFGLIVSEVFDTEEIVVKPVSRLLKDLSIYQGTTILGDGRVIMILDVAGIASAVGGITNRQGAVRTETDGGLSGRTTTMLLFDVADTTMAVPLALVARLEEFKSDEIEESGEGIVVQYRNSLLPLLSTGGRSVMPGGDGTKPQPVIVFSEGRRSMGLMVDSIRDIREERLVIERESRQPGVLGTAIINGRATDVIDTQYYVTQASPDWFDGQPGGEPARVLVVDDSMFFRQLVTTSLEADGAAVVAVDSAVEALDLVEHGEKFDLVVADLDMPGTDGFEMARRVRERFASDQLPLLAMTGLEIGRVSGKATAAGFDRVLKKFNARELGQAVEEARDAARQTAEV